MSVGDVNSTERGSGARYNDGKPDYSLIPLDIIAYSLGGRYENPPVSYSTPAKNLANSFLQLGMFQRTGNVQHLDAAIHLVSNYWPDCANVFTYGKAKYAAWNWAKGMAWSIPLACAARHAIKVLYLGEEIDSDDETGPGSGLPHAGHYLANLVMLRTFVDTYPEGNDLPPPEYFRTAEEPLNEPNEDPSVPREIRDGPERFRAGLRPGA